NAAADERIVDAQPCAPRPSSSAAPIEYIFKSDRLELNMGLKRFPVKVPCYGRHGTVSGTVLVKDFKAVTKVTITLEGGCYTSVMERGMAVYNSTKTLLLKTQVLWTRPESATCSPEAPSTFPFSFPLPTYIQGSDIRLPHSYATIHPGLNGDVTYQVRVDLYRKGLRRHERYVTNSVLSPLTRSADSPSSRLKTMILYLPRSTPTDWIPQPSDDTETTRDFLSWETVPILPRHSQALAKAKRASQIVDEKPLGDQINLILPLPKTYASYAPIPFHVSLPAESPLLPHISTGLSVHLIKYTIIRAGGFISMKEGIIGTGEIWRIEDHSYPTPPPSPGGEDEERTLATPRKVYSGTLKSFREGGESSWNIPEYLEIKYSIRLRLRAPGQDGKHIPDYYVDHPITMCTHNYIPNADDIHDPVIGLIAVSGSQGAPTGHNAGLVNSVQ
ncbi:13295_t:CDS:2, partial [Acaulospora colombiana]